MTTLTHATESIQQATKRRRLLIDTARATMFWAMAAVFVVMAHWTFAPISPVAAFAAKSSVIVIAACGYMRYAGRSANITHALFVGAGWLMLDIVTEIIITTASGSRWFLLLGTPALRFWRDALLFTWIAAPAFFAHYE